MKKTVIVGMSGGVDSSVSAYLLKEQGYNVIGLFMKNWEKDDGPCPAEQDFLDVVSVCTTLNIPYYSVNFSEKYWKDVFVPCLEDFQAGYTPNPDIFCNREIKFKAFYEKALELGADFIATGHYCRRFSDPQWQLARGYDCEKDQSYFLYTLKSEILKKVLFPIGDLKKADVRAIARKNNLITAEKKDSTGICFIGKRPFKEFLSKYISPKPGIIKTRSGKEVGKHEGAHFYTIGQRKGLKIGGSGQAWFVIEKDIENNIVYVEQGDDHPALYRDSLETIEASWVSKKPIFPLKCTAKIRYRSADVPCTVYEGKENRLFVEFNAPQKAVTPRQAIVFYQEDICLGGGLIY